MPLLAATSAPQFPLRSIDVAIVAAYLLVMLAVGVWVGRGQKSTKDYFLGDKSLPWWAVLLSIVIWRLPATDGPWASLALVFPVYYLVLSLRLTRAERAGAPEVGQ